jgi:hypothetical protein
MARKAAITEVTAAGGMVIGTEEIPASAFVGTEYSISFLRRWMGDSPVLRIYYDPKMSRDLILRLRNLFPEARFIDETQLGSFT